jgi:alpha-1,6-mannosyl-glycoprotein beta-1,2-N-acetylglucosaminyltransferase
VLHKFLTPKPRNNSHALAGTNMSDGAGAAGQTGANAGRASLNISDIRRNIERYNDMQQVLNEELFGPVQNDSLIIVVQVRHDKSYFSCEILGSHNSEYEDDILLRYCAV